MSDYQAIYDAVRSRISGGDISGTVQSVLFQCFDMGHARAMLQEQISSVGFEMVRPSVLYRPDLIQDGNAWLAMYGDLPTGCVGTGKTPADAMADFDAAWHRAALSSLNASEGGK